MSGYKILLVESIDIMIIYILSTCTYLSVYTVHYIGYDIVYEPFVCTTDVRVWSETDSLWVIKTKKNHHNKQ